LSIFRKRVPTSNGCERVTTAASMSAAIFVTIKRLETDIAWAEHWQSLSNVVGAIVKKLEP
jgi:hypothetical protein